MRLYKQNDYEDMEDWLDNGGLYDFWEDSGSNLGDFDNAEDWINSLNEEDIECIYNKFAGDQWVENCLAQ